jgi:HPt (histidine-containing phosphotransfer) domain-containing protein
MNNRGKPRDGAKPVDLVDVQSTEPAQHGGSHPVDVVMGSDCVINVEAAMNRLGGDRQLFDDMAGFFREDAPSFMRDIESGIQRKDAFAVALAAHTLKNMAATCGGEQAARVAGKIESCGRHDDLDGAAEFLPTLAGAVQALDSALVAEAPRS